MSFGAQVLGIRIPSLGCLTGQTGGHAGTNPGPLRYPFTLLRFPVGHLVEREKREEKGGRGGGSPPSSPKVIVGLTGTGKEMPPRCSHGHARVIL